MELERKGTKYEKTCQQCNKIFWTDNKRVIYCSSACFRKVPKQSPEAVKRYRQQPHIKKRLTEYNRKYHEDMKKKKLASDISAYFTFMHSARTNPIETVTHKRKKGLRR